MLKEIFTVTFLGYRDFHMHLECEEKLKTIIKDLLREKEYIDFLVGRNGEFDVFSASIVKCSQKELGKENSSLILVLPYLTAQYSKNREDMENYYDEITVCEEAQASHFKAAIQIRNRKMIERSDLIICYINKEGGAENSLKYAKKKGKKIINLAEGWMS